MEEKIKIHVTKKVYNTLLKDCESFEFFKSDGLTLNKNAFLVALINNYYQTYQQKENELMTVVKNTLDDCLINSNLEYASRKVVAKLNKIASISTNEKVSSIINFKPTKDSLPALSYIENYLLKDYSISEFFRNLFSSYASLTQDEREKIIFQEQFNTIQKAIKQKKKIFFTTVKGGLSTHESSPYALSNSKEEAHWYLLTKYKSSCNTYRLSRIKSVTIINEPSSFNEEDIKLFEKMINFGPQFTYDHLDEQIIVKLTNRGKGMFLTHYTLRPMPDFIEGDYYYFSCSYKQIYSYFRRFGKEAFIITPHSLQEKMYKFHKDAITHYQENYNKAKKTKV